MVICEQVAITKTIDGDNVQAFQIVPYNANMTVDDVCSIDFQDASDDQIFTVLQAANHPIQWYYGCNLTNPLAGDVITHITASNSSTVNEMTLEIKLITDVTL